MNSPRHDASASQHISTSTQPTTNNNTTTNTTKTTTVNNQQPMNSHTQHQATTATTVPRIDARACAQKKKRSQEQHGNSVAASGDLGSALPPSGLEQQNARASHLNSGGPSITVNLCGSCLIFGVVWFSSFNENVMFVSVFSECVAATRKMNLSHFSICAHRTCVISQHCMTDADSLHNRHVEFARGGAVNRGSFWWRSCAKC